ncbi:hypothetical protein PCANC_01648 [Puccinia coronata f. sp. avenae]|uniref:Uncharacterized protein n=1 Tax=Puccinia coronata f. sp. avenae TaxID=200324 RepID=A0A2N5W3D7_9BASI|nr:hypothetical protein PCANC_01648 [Puccinia coronata f. sp. avenae]
MNSYNRGVQQLGNDLAGQTKVSNTLAMTRQNTPAERSRDKLPCKESKRVTASDDASMERQELLSKGKKLRKSEKPHKH